jgi:propionyl-CoA carboxylase alpha chain
VVTGDLERSVEVTADGDTLTIHLPDEGRTLTLDGVDWRPGHRLFHGRLDGEGFTVSARPAPEGFAIRHRAATERVLVLSPRSAELHHKLPPRKLADTSKLIVSPMPGLVVSISVEPGQEVKSGEGVVVVEAMKMQNIIRAETDGVVKSVAFKPGDPVAADEVLVELA